MPKTKFARIAGFASTVAISAALIGAAATTTGAYFSEAKDGTATGTLGGVHLSTTSRNLAFTNLMPGEFQTETIDYTSTGTGNQDIWFVTPDNTVLGSEGGTEPGLGRYGHFELSAPAGSFVSYNLAEPGDGNSCATNANGHGGSGEQADTLADYPDYCGVPNAILLSAGLAKGSTETVTITFGVTKLMYKSEQMDSPLAAPVPFKIVATQPGVRPDDVNNDASSYFSE
jgi:hypothetical protein